MTEARRKLSRRARTFLKGVAGGLALAAVAGVSYQLVTTRNLRRRYGPPGQLVDVGGHRLHVRVMGYGSPTVVLEAGLTATSAVWGWIQPALAGVTRVVAYDRAGIGWSDSSSDPHDGTHVARQLTTLLSRLGIVDDLVLVGHSMGGLFVRLFTDQHRERVAGLVLVDPTHPDQLRRFPAEGVKLQRSFTGHMKVAPILAGLGVYRLTGGMKPAAAGLPDESLVDCEVFFSSFHHWRGVRAEMLAWDETAEQVRETRPLGDLPLLILSASRPAGALLRSIQQLHDDLATLSSRAQRRIADGADHYTILTKREAAKVTTSAILEVVAEARRRPSNGSAG